MSLVCTLFSTKSLQVIIMPSGNLFYNTVNKPFSSHPFNSYLTTTYLVSSLFHCTQGEKIATTSISHNTQKLIDDKLGVESHGWKVWIESFYGRTNPHFMVKHGAVLLIHRVCEREEKALCLRRSASLAFSITRRL